MVFGTSGRYYIADFFTLFADDHGIYKYMRFMGISTIVFLFPVDFGLGCFAEA